MTGHGMGIELDATQTACHTLCLLLEQGITANELGFVEFTEDAQTGHDR